jgi:TolA-binding protein
VNWTPSVFFLDAEGKVWHSFIGFLPPEDYLAELRLGLGRVAFGVHNYEEAVWDFRSVVESHPRSALVPQALYWLGVAEFKATKNVENLKQRWKTLTQDHPSDIWARKVFFSYRPN